MYYIYEVKNLINGKTYIGQRKCPENISSLEDNYMGSGELIKKAIKKYGLENFIKIILEEGIETKKEVDNREIYWIDKGKKDGRCQYNFSRGGTGGNLGEEVSLLMSKKWQENYNDRIKVFQSEEHRQMMRDKMIKTHKEIDFSQFYTKEVREKLSESQKKAWDKYRDIRLAQRKTEKYRKAVSEAKKGIPVPEERKKKISESVKKLHENEEYKRKFLEACKRNGEKMKGRIVSEETRRKISEGKRRGAFIRKVKLLERSEDTLI